MSVFNELSSTDIVYIIRNFMVYITVCSLNLFGTKMASSSPRSHPILSSCIECTGYRDEHTWIGLLVWIHWVQSTGGEYTSCH